MPADVDRSWIDNAVRWTDIVRSGGIASRTLATDEAIVQAVLAQAPAHVLDLGCGEGWLARRLAAEGVDVVGTDASAPLIDAARAAWHGTFHLIDYAAIAADPDRLEARVDAIVANFSLLGEDLSPLMAALPTLLRADGAMLIQTLHPAVVDPPYASGWRTETFAGFESRAPWTPMAWYFRTVGSWHALLAAHWIIEHIAEPVHPTTGMPLSLLMTLRAKRRVSEPQRTNTAPSQRRPETQTSACPNPMPSVEKIVASF